MIEFWTASAGIPGFTVRAAKRAEADGWDGFGLVDSQNLAADPFVELALAAATTSTLKLATAVANPFTRHAATMATAIATVQAESGGRAVLGIGRGDSALAHLGLAPAPVPFFERYLQQLRAYLDGGEVSFDLLADDARGLASGDPMHRGGGPEASRIRWITTMGVPRVPIDVAASGPKVIAAAARHADRITFAVGASVERLTWAIDTARAACETAERPAANLEFGMYVPLFVDPDRSAARAMVAGGVASYARFSVMHGTVSGPVSGDTREVLTEVHERYDMDQHFMQGSPQSGALTDDTIDEFGIAGPPDYSAERLAALIALGINKVFVMGGGFNIDRNAARASNDLFVERVIPALRSM